MPFTSLGDEPTIFPELQAFQREFLSPQPSSCSSPCSLSLGPRSCVGPGTGFYEESGAFTSTMKEEELVFGLLTQRW